MIVYISGMLQISVRIPSGGLEDSQENYNGKKKES